MFLAPKPRQPGYPPTLGEIKSAFPLPGRYHFRFKSPLVSGSDRDKCALAVWLDCVDDLQPVPTWKSTIIAKVTRIGIEDDEEDEDDEVYPRSTAPSSTPVAAPAPSHPNHQHSHSSGSVTSLDIFDGPVPSIQSQHSMSAPPSTSSLLDSHVAPLAAKESSLLDMGAPAYSTQTSSAPHADFFGMTANSGASLSTNHVQQMQPQRQPQQAPMSGGYPSQQQRQVQYGAPSSQQQQQQFPGHVNSYSKQNSPFGDLGTPWK